MEPKPAAGDLMAHGQPTQPVDNKPPTLFGPQWDGLQETPLPGWITHGQVLNTRTHRQWFFGQMTPAMAEDLWQRRHPGQRNLREAHAKNLRACMERGLWVNTGTPFAVLDANGYLADGQHRVLALKRSEIKALTDVSIVQVYADSAVTYMDTVSKPRTANDVLSLLGHKRLHNSVIAAFTLEFIDFIEHRRIDLTVPDQARLAYESPFRADLTTLHSVGAKLHVAQGPLAAALRCMRVDHGKAMAFFTAAFSNEHVVSGHDAPAAKLLSDYLITVAGRNVRVVRAVPVDEAAACIHAWNHWRRGTTAKRLRVDLSKFSFPVAK